MLYRKEIIAFLILFLLGCADSTSTSFRSQYENYRNRWVEAGVTSYIFNYERNGFTSTRGVWEIQVSNSKIIHVAFLGTNNPSYPLTKESAPTINSLFDEIKECVNRDTTFDNGEVTKLIFDKKTFVPIDFSCTYGSESYGFIITNYQAL